jgi:hypothetical protein
MRTALLIIVVTGLTVGVVAGQSSTEQEKTSTAPATTADTAAKPKKPKAKHVFTNEDIPERPADAPSSTSGASDSSAGSAAKPTGTAASDGDKDKKEPSGDKAAKAEAIKAAQAKVDSLKHDEDGISTVVQHIQRLISEGGEFRRTNMSEGLQKNQSDLADARKKREAAEQDLKNLQSPPK